MFKSVKIAHNELDSSSYSSCGYQEQTEQQNALPFRNGKSLRSSSKSQ